MNCDSLYLNFNILKPRIYVKKQSLFFHIKIDIFQFVFQINNPTFAPLLTEVLSMNINYLTKNLWIH